MIVEYLAVGVGAVITFGIFGILLIQDFGGIMIVDFGVIVKLLMNKEPEIL